MRTLKPPGLFWSCWPHCKSLTLAEFCLHLKESMQRTKKIFLAFLFISAFEAFAFINLWLASFLAGPGF